MVLIGIGRAGCNLIDSFGAAHKKITINIDDFPKKCSKAEEFEKFCPSFTKRLKFNEEECWVALCGAGKVAGSTLRILEKIKSKKINILYLIPDSALSTPIQLKRHRVVYNVLQQYSRSGLIHKMYIFSNKEILGIIGDQPIASMYAEVNKQIAYAVETVEWFKEQEPVLGSIAQPKEISRICSLSVGNFQKNEEKMLFSLDNCTEACYIYSINKRELEKNKNLIKLIKSRVIDEENNQITSSFAIYPSEHKQSFFYSIKYTHFIQQEEI